METNWHNFKNYFKSYTYQEQGKSNENSVHKLANCRAVTVTTAMRILI